MADANAGRTNASVESAHNTSEWSENERRLMNAFDPSAGLVVSVYEASRQLRLRSGIGSPAHFEELARDVAVPQYDIGRVFGGSEAIGFATARELDIPGDEEVTVLRAVRCAGCGHMGA